MRSFTLVYLLAFFFLFFSLGYITMRSLSFILNKVTVKLFKWIFIFSHFLVFICFLILYIYPFHISDGIINYSVYSSFNVILILIFLIDIVISFASILNFLFSPTKKTFIYIGFIISIGLTFTILTGTIFGINNIKVTRIEVEFNNLPKGFDEFKILQLSDIHLGNLKNQNNLIKKTIKLINQTDFDLLVFTGDLVNNFSYETDNYMNLFKELTSVKPSYSILGNHDYGEYTNWKSDEEKNKNFNSIISAHKEMGFKLLRNENVIINRNGDSIFLAGVENWGHPPFPQHASLEKALADISNESFTILLTHDPAHWESCIENKKNIELTLSGHTHGLQWGIKLAGIPFSLSGLTRKHWGGLYSSNNLKLYVNTGLGTIGLPWRIDMAPEITLLTLKRIKID